MSALFALGFFAATFIPNPPIEVNSSANNLLAETRQAYPVLSANSTSQLTAQGSQLVLSEASINARFTGLLSHVRWLIDQQSKSGSHSSTNSSSHSSGGVDAALFSKQIESLSDDIGDSHRDLLEQLNTIVGVTTNSVTPSSVLSVGKVDEDCLTYEATGDTWEWQTCGTGGSNFATTSINTSLKLASIVTDETGNGALVFAGSPTLTGTLSAAAANFSGNVGIGTTSPSSKFTVVGTTNPSQGNALAGWGGSLYSQEYHSLKLTSPNGSGSKRYGNDFARLEVDGTGSNAIFINKASNFLATGSGVSDSNYFIDIDSTANYVAPNSSPNSTLIGIESYANNNSGYSLGRVYGSQFGAYNGAANSVTADLIAVLGSAGNGCTNCTSTNVSGVWGDIYNAGSGVAMTNAYGLRSTFYNSGTVTNTYGLYIDDVTSGTQTNQAYGVYQVDTGARNYFAGNVGIGTTTPNAKLAISNTVAATGPELITNGSLTGSAAGWTLGNCAAYGSNQVTLTNTSCSQRYVTAPSFSTVAGRTYYVTFTISNVSDDLVYFYFNQNTIAPEWGPYHNGTYTIAVKTTYTGTESIFFGSWYNNAGSTWTIDDVSVKEAPAVTPSFVVTGYDGSSILTLGSTFGNLFFGQAAGSKTASYLNTFQNTFIGNFSGKENTNGNRNTFLGYNTGSANTTGYLNTFIGNGAGAANTIGAANTFIGENSGNLTSTGFNNLFAGHAAGSVNTSGYFNTFVGPYAGYYNTTGAYNTTLGFIAGGNITTGSNNIMLGYVDAPLATGSNQLNIGNLIFGTGLDGTGSTLSSGNIGIGTTTPLAKLSVTNTGSGRSFLVEDQANDTTPFVIDANGNVGIGRGALSSYKLYVDNKITSGSGAGGAFTVSNPFGNSTDFSATGFVGTWNDVSHNGSATLGSALGAEGGVYNESTGIITNARSFKANIFNEGGGSITNSINLDVYTENSAGSISTQKYINIADIYNAGTITNTYGVYVGDITSGTQTNTPFSFYASDSNANNYFAGNVGIGTTTPTSLLHVAKSVVGGPVATWTENTDNTNTSSNAVLGLAVGGASAGNPFLDFAVSGVTDWSIGVKNNDSDKLYISPNWALSGTPAMVMTTGGNVGIGTTTPNQILTVQGNLNLSSATGAIYFDDTKYLYASSTNDSIVFGENAGATFNSGTTDNIAIGLNAGRYASTSSADDSIYIGSSAGVNNTGWDSHLFGVDAGANNSGYSTNAIGYGAGYNNTNSDNNFFGYNAGYNNIGESGNFFGNSAGYNNTGLYNNNIFGYGAGYNNAGDENNIFGQNAGYNNTGGYTNLFGENAGRNNLGSYNNFFGGSSGYNNTGNYNDFIGYQTGRYLKSTSTVAIGTEALYGGSTYESLNNVALGYRAGYASQNSSGNNILIGYKAADNLTTGNNDIVIGYDIDNVTATADNRLNIGNLIFGTGLDGTGVTLSSGNVGIGSTTPAQKLQVLGNIRIGTSGSNGCLENFGGGVIGGTCSSDEGLKENITPLASSTSTDSYLLGIAGLTPVTYNWNEEAAKLYSKDKTMANIGLTAQDVEAAFPELVSKNPEGYRQVDFTGLQFYVIEAIKELWAKVQGHDDRINQLEQENEALKERLSHIEGKLDIQTPSQPAAVIDSTQASTTTPQTDTSTPSVIPPPATEASTTYSLIPGPSQ